MIEGERKGAGLQMRAYRVSVEYMRYALPLLALGGLFLSFALRHSQNVLPPVSVHFTGEISGGLHVNQFGRFIISNQWNRPVQWARNGVDAPGDPDLGWSASVDSNIPHGILGTGAHTNFPALIPHTKGVPFRILVGYALGPGPLDRIRARMPPLMDRVWPKRDVRRTFTSQWFHATADYTNEISARLRGTSLPHPAEARDDIGDTVSNSTGRTSRLHRTRR
jgi:hypothetical protein